MSSVLSQPTLKPSFQKRYLAEFSSARIRPSNRSLIGFPQIKVFIISLSTPSCSNSSGVGSESVRLLNVEQKQHITMSIQKTTLLSSVLNTFSSLSNIFGKYVK